MVSCCCSAAADTGVAVAVNGDRRPKPEKAEVLAAFAAYNEEVTAGYVAAAKRG